MRSKTNIALCLAAFFGLFWIEKAAAQTADETVERQAQKTATRPDFDFAELVGDGAERLDIDRLERADLENLGLLTAEKIDAFLAHRTRFGPFESLFELQAIENWTLGDIERVLPFLKKSTTTKPFRLTRKTFFGPGGHEILLRWGHVFDEKKWAAEGFEGSPDALFFRYRKRLDDRFSVGFAVEKDAGERLGGPKNRLGFDHGTAHFFVKNPAKRVKSLAFGDFLVGFGQGLVLAGGLGAAKSREALDVKSSGQRLRPKTSAMEDFFQRGAAAEVAFSRNWSGLFFASARRRDAILTDTLLNESTAFSSLAEGGMHRTEAEIRREKTVAERSVGASVGIEKRDFRLRWNGLATAFDRPFSPPGRADLTFEKSANSLIINSLDHSRTWRGLHFFGENAVGSSGGFALLNGLVAPLSRRATLAAVHRNFSKKYRSPGGRAFSENGEPRNEKGLYLGLEARAGTRWRLNFYADRWRESWLAFSEKSLGGGAEFLAAAEFSIRKKMAATARFRFETKGQDRFVFSNSAGRKSLQMRLDQRLGEGFRWSSRADFSVAQVNGFSAKKGFLLLQTLIFEPKSSKFETSLRWAIFETDGFGSRIFAHERHLTESQFVPFFYGKGVRFFTSVGWRPLSGWSLEAFVGRLRATDPARSSWEAKAQVRRFF